MMFAGVNAVASNDSPAMTKKVVAENAKNVITWSNCQSWSAIGPHGEHYIANTITVYAMNEWNQITVVSVTHGTGQCSPVAN